MGEQTVTGPDATPAPAGTPETDAAPAGPASAGMTADGRQPESADVAGAGMTADAVPGAPAGGAPAGPADRTTDIVPGPGGVMTDEVGVVTGELTLRTEHADGRVTLRVQYKDADEWYAVTGGSAPLADPAALDAVHTIAVGLLNRPEG
ncbi:MULTISPECIES: hypothetical protein [Micromonospora]|uniref:Uncharacterized protein n=1 Tax=Micromonospora chalcea TaxID=1874 RepID=A0ABX9YCM3_MICCH|nr:MULTISPECIES: hypothetical protein [Micromonospora]MBQ1065680.1 hypothetical protein [Micromonospora sp. D75]NHO84417.1 hypothetical protein [Micromonospora sp. CMU55-4]ODB74739.1 hypothetical protein A8711_30365 [Micromonospora sp. II]PPA57795.1 hypothetical protein BAW75_22910 [Micromonospora chalcea]RBQ07495.1 hypothetical protein DQE82_21675 [Micromonospora sp. LHW51205]